MPCTSCWNYDDKCLECGSTFWQKNQFLQSYYGGRFKYEVKKVVIYKPSVKSYDISSAYPYYMNHAMPKLSLWQKIKRFFTRKS